MAGKDSHGCEGFTCQGRIHIVTVHFQSTNALVEYIEYFLTKLEYSVKINVTTIGVQTLEDINVYKTRMESNLGTLRLNSVLIVIYIIP